MFFPYKYFTTSETIKSSLLLAYWLINLITLLGHCKIWNRLGFIWFYSLRTNPFTLLSSNLKSYSCSWLSDSIIFYNISFCLLWNYIMSHYLNISFDLSTIVDVQRLLRITKSRIYKFMSLYLFTVIDTDSGFILKPILVYNSMSNYTQRLFSSKGR